MTGSDDGWIMGMNFFNEYYVVFDQDNYKIGFAPSIHAANNSTNYVVDDEDFAQEVLIEKSQYSHYMVILALTALISSLIHLKSSQNKASDIENKRTTPLLR